MERRDLRDGHIEQISIEARRLLVITLDGLRRQLLIHVLAEELLLSICGAIPIQKVHKLLCAGYADVVDADLSVSPARAVAHPVR
jgi:hypothetical protein